MDGILIYILAERVKVKEMTLDQVPIPLREQVKRLVGGAINVREY